MSRHIANRQFSAHWLVLNDGDVFENCTFRDCILELQGRRIRLSHCAYAECTFTGRWPEGWPTDQPREDA